MTENTSNMTTKFSVEVLFLGKWRTLFEESRDYCLGYLRAKQEGMDLSPAMRVVSRSGEVISEMAERTELSLGQNAGGVTPEQYERAAERALAKARLLRSK